jgi:L-fuconolactonase
MLTFKPDWLNLTQEAALEPELRICDAHHHLWYDAENYTLENYLQDIKGGHLVTETVFVESREMLWKTDPPALRPVGETEFVQNIVAIYNGGLRGSPNVSAGIVGFADLTLGSGVAPVLEAHIAAGKGRFRGIRHIATWNASSEIKSYTTRGLLMDANFRQGFAYLKKYGLSFDAMIYHPQIAELVSLAKAFPDTIIILNHFGVPLGIGPYANKREEIFQEWKCGIADLSKYQNVFIKIGGIGMPILGFAWDQKAQPPSSSMLAEALKPFFNWCIEKFGTNRCIFESNFPVDKTAYSYTILWNAFKRISKGLSCEERNALFYETACNVYRLQNNNIKR